ncbi:MAG: hypothetical protein K8S27_02745 [Candidatus Omnitrophica bacterium]|nr:hypothetical protein [Candidatus Omnitrophota bacterium]
MLNTLTGNQTNIDNITKNVLKTTAVYYLAEALLNEEYEDCALLIKMAKQFGALRDEIGNVIAVCHAEVIAQADTYILVVPRYY